MRGVAILGATGSIGRSALAVLSQHPGRFRLVAATAHRNSGDLAAVVEQHRPDIAVLSHPDPIADRSPGGAEWLQGAEGLLAAATHPDVDVVINALVGAAGLGPTIAALEAGKRVALANKESLVCGGPLVLEAAERGGGELVPVDSEHSAILQCVQGASPLDIERVILTASGGPFRTWTADRLAAVTPADALRHPTWEMGAKVTIDSATLANKALEVIEAHFLFGLGYDRIDAVVHPQSIIHSMVEFADGSVLAQLGFPTMELPILYALSYPERLPYRCDRFDPVRAGTLEFEPLRTEDFPAFSLGVEAGRSGGAFPAVYNAANEVAVAAFLRGEIGFLEIGSAIASALDQWSGDPLVDVHSVLNADRRTRDATRTFIEKLALC